MISRVNRTGKAVDVRAGLSSPAECEMMGMTEYSIVATLDDRRLPLAAVPYAEDEQFKAIARAGKRSTNYCGRCPPSSLCTNEGAGSHTQPED
jgi:hypothetical protein